MKLAADTRLPHDTAIFIFEGDYTLYEIDERARQEWQEELAKHNLVNDVSELAKSLPPERATKFRNQERRWNADVQQTNDPHCKWPYEEWGDDVEVPGTPIESGPWPCYEEERALEETIEVPGTSMKEMDPQKEKNYSQDFLDLIDMVIQGSRLKAAGHPGFFWMGWDAQHQRGGPNEKLSSGYRQQSPTAGAHFSVISPVAARFLLQKFHEGELPTGHMGAQMLVWLQQYQEEEDFAGCYVVPPVGNYMSHKTTWAKESKAACLESHWQASWICKDGTRVNPDSRHHSRKVCHYRTKGHAEVVGEVFPPLGPDDWWKTTAPIDMPEEFIGLQAWHKIYQIEDASPLIDQP